MLSYLLWIRRRRDGFRRSAGKDVKAKKKAKRAAKKRKVAAAAKAAADKDDDEEPERKIKKLSVTETAKADDAAKANEEAAKVATAKAEAGKQFG